MSKRAAFRESKDLTYVWGRLEDSNAEPASEIFPLIEIRGFGKVVELSILTFLLTLPDTSRPSSLQFRRLQGMNSLRAEFSLQVHRYVADAFSRRGHVREQQPTTER